MKSRYDFAFRMAFFWLVVSLEDGVLGFEDGVDGVVLFDDEELLPLDDEEGVELELLGVLLEGVSSVLGFVLSCSGAVSSSVSIAEFAKYRSTESEKSE